jgi:hypothetical protein
MPSASEFWHMKSGWEVMAGATGALLVVFALWEMSFRVWRSTRRKRPCKAYFHISSVGDSRQCLYATQNDVAHIMREIVLPSHCEIDIEFAYYPRIEMHVLETIFGFHSDDPSRPEIIKATDSFIARGTVEPVKEYWDVKGNYHYASRFPGRSVGSCYTKGLRIRTKEAGAFKATLSFLTNDVEGNADDLIMRVEDSPRTRMRCLHKHHWQCFVRPNPRVRDDSKRDR